MAVQHRDKHSRFGDFRLSAALKTSTIYLHYALGFCLAEKNENHPNRNNKRNLPKLADSFLIYKVLYFSLSCPTLPVCTFIFV